MRILLFENKARNTKEAQKASESHSGHKPVRLLVVNPSGGPPPVSFTVTRNSNTRPACGNRGAGKVLRQDTGYMGGEKPHYNPSPCQQVPWVLRIMKMGTHRM